MLKTNQDFNKIWVKYYGGDSHYELLIGTVATDNGSLLAYAYDITIYLRQYDQKGQILAQNDLIVELENVSGAMIDTGDGYLIATANTVIKTDGNLNESFRYSLDSRAMAVAITKHSKGGYALLMKKDIRNPEISFSPPNVYLVHLNQAGKLEYRYP